MPPSTKNLPKRQNQNSKENDMKSTAQEQLKAVVERLITKIEEGNGTWFKPWKNSFPENFATKTMYSGINLFNLWDIAESKGWSNSWLTFNQLKKLNGQVQKGEKVTQVFFFKMLEIEEENDSGEIETKKIPVLKTFNVFNVDQTTLELPVRAVNHKIADIEQFICRTGIEIKQSNKGAFYHPKYDYIGIPARNSFVSSDFYYAVLFHEMGHSTMHPDRCDRKEGSKGSQKRSEEQVKQYATEELIAETVRTFLQCKFGLNSTEMEEQNALYLKGWLKPLKSDPRMLWSIFSEASKAFNYLIKATEDQEESNEAA
jgi:antirestriction protein ArdC